MAASTHRITCLAGVQSIRVVGTLTEGGVVRDLKAKACYTTSTCFVVTRARARPNNGKLWHGFTSGGVQEPGDTYRRPIRRARSRCTTLFIL